LGSDAIRVILAILVSVMAGERKAATGLSLRPFATASAICSR
jgi:hypothetical protein